MAKQDHRINEHGISVVDLFAGQWVVLEWNDADDEVVLVLEVEDRSRAYKGARGLKVLARSRNGVMHIIRPCSSQVKQVLSEVLMFPKL
jgi:hypothetical protein